MSTVEDRRAARERLAGSLKPPCARDVGVDVGGAPPTHGPGAYIAAVGFGVPVGFLVGLVIAVMTGAIMLC